MGLLLLLVVDRVQTLSGKKQRLQYYPRWRSLFLGNRHEMMTWGPAVGPWLFLAIPFLFFFFAMMPPLYYLTLSVIISTAYTLTLQLDNVMQCNIHGCKKEQMRDAT